MNKKSSILNQKNDIEVLINNKKYVLCGYESADYLQRVASYINNKYSEFRQRDGYSGLEPEMRDILVEINLADDYFKAKEQAEELSESNESKDNELFDLKHEVIAAKTKQEALEKELKALKEDYNEAQKRIVKLETELSERGLKEKKMDSAGKK